MVVCLNLLQFAMHGCVLSREVLSGNICVSAACEGLSGETVAP